MTIRAALRWRPDRRWWGSVRALSLTIGAATGLLIALSSVGIDLDRGLSVWRASLHPRAATGRVALVEIDAKSLAAFNRWPWRRSLYARALERLNQAGAGTVAFDVDFSAPSSFAEDAALARAIVNSPKPVILPTFRQAASQSGAGLVQNLPIPALRDHAQLAAVNIFPDRDGLIRSYPFGVITGGVPRPSIGAILAGVGGRAETDFPIDGSIDPSSIPRISFVDLLAGRAAPGLLANRSILIGGTAIELGDQHSVAGRGVLAGPMVQLLAAETLLQHSAPVSFGWFVPLVLALLALAASGRAPRGRGLLMVVFAALTIFLLPLLLELTKLGTVEVVPALTALASGLVATTILSAMRAARDARMIDADTGLPNARSFRAVLHANPEQGSVVALRLVNYGEVASVFGRARAAELVRRASERLAFTSDGDVYRVEDNALAWTIATVDPEEQSQRIDAAAALVRAPFEIGGRPVELAVGFGLATPAMSTSVINQALSAADRAVVKGTRWIRHSADLDRDSAWRLGIAAELDRAMAAGDIWVAYQPKLDVRAGRINAVEALVRWRHPERGAIPPDAFIPLLEENDRIADLTLYVLEQAMADRQAWARAGLNLGVAVNVSALLPTNPEFMARLEATLAQRPGEAAFLTLEVTESATMTDSDSAVLALEHLAALGVSLSIDDYGTGQSTLSYLKRLPAREIKIDKSFVLALETSRGDQAMVRSTIELAHELGFKVVAEGVETEMSLRLLSSFDCDTAQGWHIGRPMPSDQLVELVGRQLQLAA